MRELSRVASQAVDARGKSSTTGKGEYLLFHCLVVSSDVERQQMLARAAAEQGWETIVVGDCDSAIRSLQRLFVQLAIVDLERDECGDLQDAVEQLSSRGDLLTIVCGHADDMEEEIFVRQLGAWLYLPGVDAGTNLSLLCGEARHIVERQHAAAHASARPKSPLRRAN